MLARLFYLSLIAATITAVSSISFAAAPAAPAADATPPAARGAGPAGGGRLGGGAGRAGGSRAGAGRGPVVIPPPSHLPDLGMPVPVGALPIKGPNNSLAYIPDNATAGPIVGPDGASGNLYWSTAIQADPGDLKVYAEANAKLAPPKPGENRVVFLGDSITEKWQKDFPSLFPGKANYIGRGSTSESTQQMLMRFRPDVVKLGAKVVVLQAGVGDVAGNTGDVPDSYIHDNFQSILDIAKVNNVKVVWISTLPADKLFWRPGLEPAKRIADLVAWEKDYASKNGVAFVDAYSKFKDANGGMQKSLTTDGVHPNAEAYKQLSAMVQPEIDKALK